QVQWVLKQVIPYDRIKNLEHKEAINQFIRAIANKLVRLKAELVTFKAEQDAIRIDAERQKSIAQRQKSIALGQLISFKDFRQMNREEKIAYIKRYIAYCAQYAGDKRYEPCRAQSSQIMLKPFCCQIQNDTALNADEKQAVMQELESLNTLSNFGAQIKQIKN